MAVMPPKNCECCHGPTEREYYSLTHTKLYGGGEEEDPVRYFCSQQCVVNYLNDEC
jgi:hypothetical protein